MAVLAVFFYIKDVLDCLHNTFQGSIRYPNTCVCGWGSSSGHP